MSTTAGHHSLPLATRAKRTPTTRTLSARGSRKAPDRVAPWRRATTPSATSVIATPTHTPRAAHEGPSASTMVSSTGVAITRIMVRAFAGVARAEGPKLPVDTYGAVPAADHVASRSGPAAPVTVTWARVPTGMDQGT